MNSLDPDAIHSSSMSSVSVWCLMLTFNVLCRRSDENCSAKLFERSALSRLSAWYSLFMVAGLIHGDENRFLRG